MSYLMGKKAATGSTGRLAEGRAAKRLGGKLTPASGALEGSKGDFLTSNFLVENKATEKGSLKLELDWLLKIAQEARERNLEPALAVQFVRGDGKPYKGGGWVMIRESLFKELVG